MNKKTLSKIGLWIMIALVCIVLIPSAFTKLTGHEAQVSNASNWGFPYWLMYLIALYEIAVSTLFVIGKRVYASFALIIMMVIAIVVHLLNNEALFTILNFILIAIAIGIYFINKTIKSKLTEISN